MPHHDAYLLDPLLPDSDADAVLRLCQSFPRYGTYAEEGLNDGIGEGLPQRADAAFNYVKTGGRLGQRASTGELGARTNYFRETYAYGDEISAPGIEPFLHAPTLIEAARKLHGRPVIVPAIVFANVYLPGQELALHTDVPEFRGANRKLHPQWLLVVMRHSELFEEWRMPIATGVAFFGEAAGGALAYYPDGPDGPAKLQEPRHNTALLLDTDTVFHGVDRVGGPDAPLTELRSHMQLVWDDAWSLREDEREVARYPLGDVRFSVSWKAYCFRDDAERESWARHSDDLELDFILERLIEDLRRRGRLTGAVPEKRELALTLIDEYIHFPPPEA